MIRPRTTKPNYREIFGGLAVLTILAGLSVTRWGLPQSGRADFKNYPPHSATEVEPANPDKETTLKNEQETTESTEYEYPEYFTW